MQCKLLKRTINELKENEEIIERILLWQIVIVWNDNFRIVKNCKWKSLSDRNFIVILVVKIWI